MPALPPLSLLFEAVRLPIIPNELVLTICVMPPRGLRLAVLCLTEAELGPPSSRGLERVIDLVGAPPAVRLVRRQRARNVRVVPACSCGRRGGLDRK